MLPLEKSGDCGNLEDDWSAFVNHRKTMGKPWENDGKMMVFDGIQWDLPNLVMANIAMEKSSLKWWIFPLNKVIFQSYLKLPGYSSRSSKIQGGLIV